jgi:hypothetical protein
LIYEVARRALRVHHPYDAHQRRKLVRNIALVGTLAALVLGWVGLSQAQEARLAAFALHCVVPTADDRHTRAVLVGQITFATRTDGFVVSCYDGPSTSRFPDILVSDGEVQAIDVSVVTVLEDSAQQMMAYTSCEAHGQNGFLTLRCMASETDGGEVNVLVSIAPVSP